jgi:hypothetical protein
VSWQEPKSLQGNIESLSFSGGMNTLTETGRSAAFRDGQMIITLASGREIRFAVSRNPRLAKGSVAQLNHFELSPFGIHWPELDEDLSFAGLLEGDFGQRSLKPSGSTRRKRMDRG